jgi:copper chaperone NosL
VPDFLNRDEWIEARSAVYLHSETLRSPMGLNLSAYENREAAEEMQQEYGGEIGLQ